MKRTLKKVLSLLLCAALLSGMMANSAFAAKTSGKCGKNAKWSYNAKTKTLTISGKGTANEPDFYPPETRINVVVKEGITRLKEEYSDYYMRSLKLPDTLVQMEGFCYSILPETITLPKSLTKLPSYWCSNCDGLKTIKVAKGNPKFIAKDGVLFTKDMKNLYSYPPVKKAKKYTIPSGVKHIKCGAFPDDYPRVLVIPKSVTVADEFAIGIYTSPAKIYFKGKPPKGVVNMFGLEEVGRIYYPRNEEEAWDPVIKKLRSVYGSGFKGGYPWDG